MVVMVLTFAFRPTPVLKRKLDYLDDVVIKDYNLLKKAHAGTTLASRTTRS